MTDTHAAPAAHVAPRERGGNGVGIASFVAACLGLGPVAIVLGIVGLARWRSGRASRRSWPLAGLVLGVVATLVAAGLAAAAALSVTAPAAVTARAELDVIAIGNAVVDYSVAHPNGPAPAVTATPDGYEVAGTSLPAELEGSWTPELRGTTAYDWCVALEFETTDGMAEVGYSASDGLVAACPPA